MNRLIAVCFVALAFASLNLVLSCSAGTQASGDAKNIRIIYTNDTIGYLEPCGCGGRDQGGLARRASLVARLVRENPDSLLVDSGNLSDEASKLPLVAKLMADMHYVAVGIGEVDSGFGDYLRVASSCGLKVIDTTVPSASSASSYLIRDIRGVRVGVVSFGKRANNVAGKESGSLKLFSDAYRKARKQSDILVLLDQGGIAKREWLEGEAAQIGVPDIVIGGVTNSLMPREQIVGKTHIVPTSVQGKQVGVIDISFSNGERPASAVHMVPVDKNLPEDEAVRKQISDFLTKPQGEIPNVYTPTARKDGAYIDSASCKACHPDEYEDWRKTNHAQALQTLKLKDRLIPECLSCHSQEFRKTRKYDAEPDITAGVECATCHAAVLPHGADGPPATATRKVDARMCLECHTGERSPSYNQEVYLPMVSHTPGR